MTTEGTIHFLDRDPLYRSQKPYSLRFAPETIPQTNLKPIKKTVNIKNIREIEQSEQLDFESSGFGVVNMTSSLSYTEFFQQERVTSVYYKEVGVMLREVFKARHVCILDHVVRVRHAQFPRSTGENYEYDQPTTLAHVDFTHDGASAMMDKYLDLNAGSLNTSDWKCVNVWKPLRGPIQDWPLALCSAESMNFTHDSVAGDVVTSQGPLEDLHIHYSNTQEWYFLKDQQDSELLLFQSSDSAGKIGAPHASFPMPDVEIEAQPRQSIEVRAFIFF